MNNENWDDLRFVLAVAETGSVNRAGRALGVTHATVLRRIAAFEDRHGGAVFQKTRSGYRVLPDRMSVIDSARRVQDVMENVERSLKGRQARLSGRVRITSTDSMCQLVLPRITKRIAERYPDLSLSLLSANSHLDFERLSADVAVRPALRLDEGLVGERAGTLDFAIYESHESAGDWLALGGPLARSAAGRWIEQNIEPSAITHTADSFLVLSEMVASGMGRTLIPTIIGDSDERLRRSASQPPNLSTPIWVAGQRELAETVRFKVVREFLVEELRKLPPGLSAPTMRQSS